MPLAPVPPLPSLPSLPELPARHAGPSTLTRFLAAVVVVSLALNGLSLWSQRAQSARLARLEAALGVRPGQTPTAEEGPVAATGRLPRRAGPEQRLAALLAVSGDADRGRRLLETLTPDECSQIGQALIARPPASDRNGALTAVFASLAASEPARGIALLDGVQEAVLRTALARQLVEIWTARDAGAAANWLATDGTRFLDGNAAGAPMLRAVTQWATFDPEGATRFTAAQAASDRGALARALAVASREWGQTNAPAALAWVDTLPAADRRRAQALQSVWEGWTERDAAAAGAALRQQFYAGGTLRPPVELAGSVARRWAQVDPASAAQWAAGLPTNGTRTNALVQVAATWATGDRPAAAQWAATLPASAARTRIWKEIVNDWESEDAGALGAWLGGLPLGPDHDEAVGAYLPKIELLEPEKALVWASTVSDPALRAEQVQGVLARWERRDTVAAHNWAAANGVPILRARTAER